VGIVISIISFLLASLVFFNDQLAVAQKKYLQDFHWLVLVRGDQLGVDEVGRFLRQFDGVERAEYMSSDTLLGRVAKEGVSDEDLNFIKAGSLPSAWEVKWTEEADMRKMLTESLVDIKNFPGVVDVLYSGDTLRNIQTGRWLRSQLKLCLSGLILIGLFLGLLLLGKVLFFSSVSLGQFKGVWPFTISALLFWSAGVGLFSGIVARASWGLFGAALLAALFRSLFILAREHE
jgi:cell division protein FtsX